MRKLLLILFMFSFSCAKAQTPMHWLTWQKTVAPLFDAFPSGQWGVSFRKLRQGYLGSCVRVRRMSDNAEQDIGFNGNFCDTVALKTFVGASTAKAVTWYDQSGNGLNFATVDTAHQPLMVASVGLIYNYSHALSMISMPEGATSATNARNYLRVTYTGSATSSTFIVLNTVHDFGSGVATPPFGYPSPVGGEVIYSLEYNSSYFMIAQSGSGSNAYSGIGTPLSWVNGVSMVITTRGNVADYITIPETAAPILYSGMNLNMSTWTNASLAREAASSGYFGPTYYTEYIMYGTDQTSNRIGIEANINSYYNIY